MFRKVFSFQNDQFQYKEQDTDLVFSFSPAGFTVIQFSLSLRTIHGIEEYKHEPALDFESDKQEFSVLLKKYRENDQNIRECRFILNSQIYTPVPDILFDERNSGGFISFITENSDYQEENVMFRQIQSSAESFYVVFKNLKWQSGLVEGNGHEDVLLSDVVVFVKAIMNSQKYFSGVFVQVGYNYFDVLILQQKKLRLINRFAFGTSKDFCYHLVGSVKAAGLNIFDETLHLCGEILPGSEITAMLGKYASAIQFLIPEDAEIPESVYAHRYFNQLSVL